MNRDDVLFIENFAAAQSFKNRWTRLASTCGCMMIILSAKTLTIKPHWFAGWMISLLHLDLCHEVPLANIRGVRETGRWFSHGKVELHFRTKKDEDQRILLYLKKSGEFVDKLASAIQQ